MSKKKFTKYDFENHGEETIVEILVSEVGEFCTINILSKILRVSRSTVSRAIDTGSLVAMHFGHKVIIVTRSIQSSINILG